MADFTHSSRSTVRVYRSARGAPQIKAFQESTCGSSAVIQAGNVVSLDIAASTANHRIVRCSSATDADPILSTAIVGVAAQGSTSDGSTTGLGTKGRDLIVFLADETTEFLFPTKAVLGSSLVGTPMRLQWESTLHFHYASVSTGDPRIWVTGLPDNATAGDTGGYIVGKFTSTAVAPVARVR